MTNPLPQWSTTPPLPQPSCNHLPRCGVGPVLCSASPLYWPTVPASVSYILRSQWMRGRPHPWTATSVCHTYVAHLGYICSHLLLQQGTLPTPPSWMLRPPPLLSEGKVVRPPPAVPTRILSARIYRCARRHGKDSESWRVRHPGKCTPRFSRNLWLPDLSSTPEAARSPSSSPGRVGDVSVVPKTLPPLSQGTW